MRASFGQGWNQSMEVELIIPGNLRALTLMIYPTGEKHKIIFNILNLMFLEVFTTFKNTVIAKNFHLARYNWNIEISELVARGPNS